MRSPMRGFREVLVAGKSPLIVLSREYSMLLRCDNPEDHECEIPLIPVGELLIVMDALNREIETTQGQFVTTHVNGTENNYTPRQRYSRATGPKSGAFLKNRITKLVSQ